jgi:hypothetical protein
VSLLPPSQICAHGNFLSYYRNRELAAEADADSGSRMRTVTIEQLRAWALTLLYRFDHN